MLVIIDNYTTLQVLKPASRKTLGVLLCFISLCQVLFSSALTTFITHLISVKMWKSTCTMVHMWSQKIKFSFVWGGNSSNIFRILLNSIFLLQIQLSVFLCSILLHILLFCFYQPCYFHCLKDIFKSSMLMLCLKENNMLCYNMPFSLWLILGFLFLFFYSALLAVTLLIT